MRSFKNAVSSTSWSCGSRKKSMNPLEMSELWAITNKSLVTPGELAHSRRTAKFKNGADTDLCLLCQFILFMSVYHALSSVKQSYISEKETILLVKNPLLAVKLVIKDKFIFTQLILDYTAVIIANRVVLCPQECQCVHRSLNFCP